MLLEDYFLFEKTDSPHGAVARIRIKGHRIRIENVIECFNQGMEPGQIQREVYPTLTLEEVYAAITYYLHNKAEVDKYVGQAEAIADAQYQEYLRQEPSPLLEKLRAAKAQQQGSDAIGP